MPKNVLFIICHDIGRRFGCYGNKQIHTPNIDRLAKQSMVFDRHYCNYALCGPSRATLFTGCRPETTQRLDNNSFFPRWREQMRGIGSATLPEHFRNNGYFCEGLGQVFHGHDQDDDSWSKPQWWPRKGKGDSHETLPEWVPPGSEELVAHWMNPESHALMKERLQKVCPGMSDPHKRWMGPAVEAGDLTRGSYPTEMLTRKGLQSLKERKADGRPFFLGIGYEIGHLPWCAPKEFFDLYNREQLDLPTYMEPPRDAPEFAYGNNEPAQYYTQDLYDKPWFANEKQHRELLHGAYAAVSYFDAQVGRLVGRLEDLELGKDTVVVLTTDHGFSYGEHGKWGKHNIWEASLSVPLLISDPEQPESAGKRTSALTEHVDILPTLCDLCCLPKPDHLEGTSASPLLKNPTLPWKEAVFSYVRKKSGQSVRTDRYRYNVYKDEKEENSIEEFYDYELDPDQTINRISDSSYKAEIEHMRSLIRNGWKPVASKLPR